jgi:hypothetical protein
MWIALDHVQLAIPRGSEDECRRFYVDILSRFYMDDNVGNRIEITQATPTEVETGLPSRR